MGQQSSTTNTATGRTWAEQSLGERVVVAAWRAVAAHLAAAADPTFTVAPAGPGQVATGGAGATDGVTDDALPPPRTRERLR